MFDLNVVCRLQLKLVGLSERSINGSALQHNKLQRHQFESDRQIYWCAIAQSKTIGGYVKDYIFKECLERQKNSKGRPFWQDMLDKYPDEGYKNAEQLRGEFRREKKKRGYPTEKKESFEEKTSYEEGDNFINIVCSSKRMLTKEDVIEQFKIDEDIWEVSSFEVKTAEGYRKDRSVDWDVEDGKVLHGKVRDTGKMLIVPLYYVRVKLIKKVKVSKAKDAIHDMIEDAKKFAPLYHKNVYSIKEDGLLYEIAMPDIHFGRLAVAEETGMNYDIALAKKSTNEVVDKLLSYASRYSINEILLPIGNDFFNVDNQKNTTTRGTPQQESQTWKKTFKEGRELMTEIIDKCSDIAPVRVLVIPGNHDEERSFYLGEALDCWYHNNPNVKVDNSSKNRKYCLYGKNLIGFTHGYSENLDNLPLLMAIEAPDWWAKTKIREWHTGDKHHKKDIIYAANEKRGIMVRILRSLAVADAWTFDKGFVGAIRAGESFMWHPEDGLIAQFTAMPNEAQ